MSDYFYSFEMACKRHMRSWRILGNKDLGDYLLYKWTMIDLSNEENQ